MQEKIYAIRAKQDSKARWVTIEEFEDLHEALEALKVYKKKLVNFKHVILDQGY